MHEAKLCLSLIDLAGTHLRRAGGERIAAMRLEVGDLCGVIPEALEAAFPICASGTRAENAALHIYRTQGRNLVLRDMEIV
jgi:hydrogenase nickel incorporation protein HypA/HybF